MHGAQGTSLVVSQLPSLAVATLASYNFFPGVPFFFLIGDKVSPVGNVIEFSESFLPHAQMFVFSHVGVVAVKVDDPETGTAVGVFLYAKSINGVLPYNKMAVQMLWTIGTYRDSFSSHFYGEGEWETSFAFY